MTALPPALHDHLAAPSLAPMWTVMRERLERTGHAIRGSIVIDLDDDGADRLGGLLGRSLSRGTFRVRLADLDAALRVSAAGRGLVGVVAELTGGALRDRPAERAQSQAGREQLWAHLDTLLVAAGLADEDWVTPWTEWLHRGGVLSRLPAPAVEPALSMAVRVIAAALAADGAPRSLAELATEHTGTAHGLDDGTAAGTLALRGVAFAVQAPLPASAAERRALWQRVGVSTDEISGTVLVWALRPPGADRWSAMMRERADLGLVTHLTVHELQRAPALIPPGEVVHACENPQVLQQLAAAGADRPVICTSGNPAAAGSVLLDRVTVRYHGDFDWPGIAIARRIITRGATPWRMGHDDYLEATARLPADHRLALTGRPEATPWDERLQAIMIATDVAVHEEAIVDLLLADLCDGE
jgi:uncharacterized protein (TIGR02679 family)